MKGDVFHEELPDGRIRTSTVSDLTIDPMALIYLKRHGLATVSIDGEAYSISRYKPEEPKRQATANDYWVAQPDGSRRLITMTSPVKKLNPNDEVLREIVEEVITKSHRQWRSIPETALLVLRAIEDYQSGN
jgi:hypothetical protein